MSRTNNILVSVGAILLVFVIALLLPCTQVIRDGQGWVGSANSVRQISLALNDYHDIFKKLPPAVVRDKDGKPLYSWRVLLLPFLEQVQLYNQFKLDEPWDSPHNEALVGRTPNCYLASPFLDNPPGTTRYQVFVGPGTAFERPGLTWKDFTDGRSQTILVVEGGEAVPWSKPADLAYDPNGPLPPLGAGFGKPSHFLCYEVGRRPGFNAGFADGSARFILQPTDEHTIRSLITRNGGETIDLSKLDN